MYLNDLKKLAPGVYNYKFIVDGVKFNYKLFIYLELKIFALR